jgi:predicted SAM-dependent methyltransferase
MKTFRTKTLIRALAVRAQQLKFHLGTFCSQHPTKNGIRPPTDRLSFFSPVAQGMSSILEIGPLHAPICPRPPARVRYVDAFTTEELRDQYRSDPNVDIEQIVDVDYVWRGERYSELISERFGSVVTSHNIEHVPCLVSFFSNLESVLNTGGKIYFAIPDKRYCFDHYKSESSLEEVIFAHFEKRTRPGVSSLFRQRLLVTHNKSLEHWLGNHGQPAFMACTTESKMWKAELEEMIKTHSETNNYVDTHVWMFTPLSFAQLVSGLRMLDLTTLELEAVHQTAFGSHEFYAVLRKP